MSLIFISFFIGYPIDSHLFVSEIPRSLAHMDSCESHRRKPRPHSLAFTDSINLQAIFSSRSSISDRVSTS